ncbi:plasmid pRiA4b ORF-3 family protein [Gloeobacter morelensis]|uniref:plasmid pRiA4b ORF-3 family protein n=1 Tax=Gloeobacter morelensis TaxID=2907343 RepID=UPI001E5368BC|nr:plasmid pRiA4b ORF-3 family protein [Gloeobacter morelensis]
MTRSWSSSASFASDRVNASSIEYDFADRWQLDVRLEAILPAEAQQVYPVCTAGKQACPPEECGGVENYLAQRRLLWQTEPQDLEVLTEFTIQVAQRQPEDPALGLAQGSEEYAALVLAAQRTQAREHLKAGSFNRHELNQQLCALPLCCEVSDALSAPGGLHR